MPTSLSYKNGGICPLRKNSFIDGYVVQESRNVSFFVVILLLKLVVGCP